MNTPSPVSSHASPHLNTTTLTQHPDGSAGEHAHTVVMLHGWGKNIEVLRSLGELLVSDSVKVHLIDLPGFGLSPLPHEASSEGRGWSTDDYANVVLNHLEAMGLTSYSLIGHSFGGRISVRISARHPERVKSLTLIGSHGIPPERTPLDATRLWFIRKITKVSKWVDENLGLDTFKRYFAPRFGSLDYKMAGDLRKTLVKTVNEDLTNLAATISAPTLLLWGEKDPQTPLSIARKFKALIKDSSLFIFPNKGHEPYLDVGSHLLAKYINRFLQDNLS